MYFVFIGVYLLLGAVLPSLFLLYLEESPSMWDQMVDPASLPEGLRYIFAASAIFIVIALARRPPKPAQPVRSPMLSGRLIWICWGLGAFGHCITILLNLRYGMSPSNLTAQRPFFAILLGYMAMIGGTAGAGFFFHELRFGGFSRRLLIYLMLQCAALATSWSRSAVVLLACAALLAMAYSPKARAIRLPKTKPLLIVGLLLVTAMVSVVCGQRLRGGETAWRPLLFEGLQRLFANNTALFLAVDRFDEVNRILLEDQPEVMFDQMLSFVRTRTRYPSSFRFLELGGGTVEPDERGHIAGYAYGWLGVTYGVGRFWAGLALLAVVLWLHFHLLLVLHRRSRSLLAVLFFAVLAGSLFEFLFNLGIDSFVEKLFKNSLYAVLAYFLIESIAYVTRKPRVPGLAELVEPKPPSATGA